MRFTDDEMWQATIDCDKNYDGKFFYAVKTVGVYCRPSCKSRTPLRKNVSYFETSENAQNAGFRPCKRCRPDLTDYSPLTDLAKQTKTLIDDYCCRREQLTGKLAQLGVSTSHLAVIFKQQYGFSPMEYLNKLRMGQAQKMLAETNMPIIDIAGEIGFDSLSAFYGFFRRHTGTTPKAFRLNSMEIEGGRT